MVTLWDLLCWLSLIHIWLRERECDKRLGGHRANFPCGICEVKTSQMLLEDKSSSIGYLEDNGSANSPLSCCCVSGKPRWCLNTVVLFSAWNVNVK